MGMKAQEKRTVPVTDTIRVLRIVAAAGTRHRVICATIKNSPRGYEGNCPLIIITKSNHLTIFKTGYRL